MKPALSPDFDVIDLDTQRVAALNRRAMWWLVGLMALLTVSAVALVLLLQDAESQEEDRSHSADADWLDQAVRFHFRRLESDLTTLALQAQNPQATESPAQRAGQLWRTNGAIVFHGWLPAEQQPYTNTWPAAMQAVARAPDAAAALAAMLDTGRGLQRPAYAGPLPAPESPDTPMLWLAVPVFEQQRFTGNYVAAVDMQRAVEATVPSWFLKAHAVTLAASTQRTYAPTSGPHYLAPIHLPGAQWTLAVNVLDSQPATTPRTFLAVALVCLGGMLLTLHLLWRDMAVRRRTESQLQTQLALRTAMERSVILGLRAWDLNGRLLHVNQAFCHQVGWSAPELLLAGHRLYWPDAQGDEFAHIRSCGTEHHPSGVEMQLRHKNGQVLDVWVHSAPLNATDGTLIGWMGSTLDITERKRIEGLAARQQEKLESSARLVAVGEVASTLAHELNQPLGALTGFATGLLNRLHAGDITLQDVAPVVERMERLADKAGRVIQRVNTFARRQEMSPQPLEITAFVRRVASQVPLPEDVALELPPTEPEFTVQADVLLLEHALHNTVLNAVEWSVRSTRTPRVRVSLRPAATHIGLRVEDSGPGIPDAVRPRIFEAFTSHKPGGMGMGLSICRSIIEAHHGHIEVDRSEALEGAQFTLWIPLPP